MNVGLILGVLLVLIVGYVIVSGITKVYENEEVYGYAYTDEGIENLLECYDFCGSENVRHKPSTMFKQEICECKPK